MSDVLKIDVITIFPQMLNGFLQESMMKRATAAGQVKFRTINPRDFTTDKHRTTDDRPFGGGPGMVLKPEPIFEAIEALTNDTTQVVMLTPQGESFGQPKARALSAHEHLLLLCGSYEGFDERVRTRVHHEISIGDYVLTNGALPAMVVIDAVTRLLPGVLGDDASSAEESFSEGMLEYPQYTRPADFRGMKVPEVLLSGNHAEIEKWRREQAAQRTAKRRPDLQKDNNENFNDETTK